MSLWIIGNAISNNAGMKDFQAQVEQQRQDVLEI